MLLRNRACDSDIAKRIKNPTWWARYTICCVSIPQDANLIIPKTPMIINNLRGMDHCFSLLQQVPIVLLTLLSIFSATPSITILPSHRVLDTTWVSL